MAGKGSKPRPIVKKKFDENFDEIKWKTEEEEKFKVVKKGAKIIKRFVYK